MKKIIFFLALFIPVLSFAQEPFCNFIEKPDRVGYELLSQQVYNRVTEDSTTILKIPVVVHVLHLKNPIGSVNNPTEASIRETIDYLTNSFRDTWPAYPDTLNGGKDLRIEFVLATKDRSGKPFNGIDRIDASGFTEYAQLGRVRGELLLATMWDKYKYFNIWVVNRLEGGGGGFGAAPEPFLNPIFNYEGIVVPAFNFKPGNNIVVHEAGHYFGLSHTWGVSFGNSCPPNNNCETDGDFICDTEPHSELASCELIGTINPCTGLPYGTTLNNFMSYSTSFCRNRFTRLQMKRMRGIIMGLRPGIPNSELTVQASLTIKELNDFKILPNPNSGNFTIYLIAPVAGSLSLSILNAVGQQVFQKTIDTGMQTQLPVTTNNLPAGVYFVLLGDKSGVITRRFFIR